MQTATTQPLGSIAIHGRRWFQRSYGNTYFTADILVNGELVTTLPKQYGYGDHYVDIASQWLEDNGYISRKHYDNGSAEPLWQVRDREGFSLYTTAVDVSRQKDL